MRPSPDRDIVPDEPGDAIPWRELARRLLVFARGLGASVEEAEDVVQDALQHVAAHPDWFDPGRGSLPAALRTVVRNAWLNRRRHDNVRQRAVPRLAVVTTGTIDPDVAVRSERARDRRHRVLALLEPEERAVFEAWLGQRTRQCTAKQAARSLSLSVAAYEAAKKRLRRRVRAAIEQLELTPADLFDPPESP